MATNISKDKGDTVTPAPAATKPEKSKSSDLVLTIKLVLFAAAFIAALWALDRYASL